MLAVGSVAPAAIITIVAVLLCILAIVVFLLAIIVELRTISLGLDEVIPPVAELVAKTQPVNQLVDQIVGDLVAGTNLLEGLLVKKAGVEDAGGLIESLFPGGGQAFLARQGRPGKPRHFGVVYSRGALQLARLGRGAPLGAALRGAPLRDPAYASESPRSLYPDPRGVGATRNSAGAPNRPRSPVIGGGSPTQYRRPGDDSVIYDSSTDASAPPSVPGSVPATTSFATGGASRFGYSATGTALPGAVVPSTPGPGPGPVGMPGRAGPPPPPPPAASGTPQPAAAAPPPAAATPPPPTPAQPVLPGGDDVIRYRR